MASALKGEDKQMAVSIVTLKYWVLHFNEYMFSFWIVLIINKM